MIEVKIGKSVYKYLWLKWAGAFDPSEHCAKCLTGKFSEAMPQHPKFWGPGRRDHSTRRGKNVPDFEFLYLCGVHQSWIHGLNRHVPLRRKEGAVVHYTDPAKCVDIRVEGFEIVPIVYPEHERYESLPDVFKSCRNYQFGWIYLPWLDALPPFRNTEGVQHVKRFGEHPSLFD